MVNEAKRRGGWIVLAGLLFSWLGIADAGADVIAGVNRSQVSVGEVFELKIRSAGDALAEEPDLTPLEKEFLVVARSRSLQTRVVNGQSDASMEWRIQLLAREPGERVIPPLVLGSESTEALAVTVVARGSDLEQSRAQSPGASFRTVELAAEVDRDDSYVQEQVILSLRLESDLPLTGGALGEPEIAGAIVERMGEDRSERVRIEGRETYVFERRYAIFPQQSGELRVPSLIFDGTVRDVESRRGRSASPFGSMLGGSLFDDFLSNSDSLLGEVFGARGRRVRAVSEPIVLAIRERPAEALGARWLPARGLELVELWGEGDSEPPSLRVGEPVNRVVAVRARGVTASQLPLPEIAEVDGIKQYTEPAYEDSQGFDREMVALRALPTVLIPTKPGRHVLPEVEIQWWDTESDQARIARLPARTLEVAPALGTTASAMAPPSMTSTGPPPPEAQPGPGPVASLQDDPALGPMAVSALAIGLLVSGLGYGAWRRFGGVSAGPSDQPGRRSLRRGLEVACSAGDAAGAEAALLALGRACWPQSPPHSTAELARRLASSELQVALRELSEHRFAADGGMTWEGRALWQAFRGSSLAGWRFRANLPEAPKNLLPELYPVR
ncbi:MAG: BatD family protein [Myxococcota bacterium]|nr:BatD family protein [Myxococcota bacterium]